MSDIEYELKNSRPSEYKSDKTDPSSGRFNDLLNFYRFLTPQDEFGKLKLFTKKRVSEKDITKEQFKVLFDTYIKSTLPGKKIIETLKQYTNIPFRGVGYQTAAIDSTGKATFLDREYWITKSTKPSQSAEGAGQEITAENYYQNICTTQGEEPGVDVTINVLRMPLLSDIRKSVDDVSLFLNHIPSHFASQMVPYLDVEFQMPRLPNDTIKNSDGKITGAYLNRPSIIRYLLGSLPPLREETETIKDANGNSVTRGTKVYSNKLSPVDAAMIATFEVAKNAQKGGKTGPGPVQNTEQAFITGMEMFTSPQTLTNMDELKAKADSRLMDVKPFLPPATLTGASITIINAGSINQPQVNASLEFRVHDKARLVEFSEFVRGQSGAADITFWITFGWLAPKGKNNEDNAYAKFINETMLNRYSFSIKNVGYSFDNTGQATVKLDLNTKAYTSIEQGRIDVQGSPTTSVFRQLPKILNEIKQLRNAISSKSSDAEQAFKNSLGVGSDNRIAQSIEALETGNLEPSIDPNELLKILQAEGRRIKAEQPFNQKAWRLIQLLLNIYQIDPVEKMPVWKVQQRNESRDFAKSKFDSFRREGEDPFLPTDAVVKREGQPDQRLFGEDLIKAMTNYVEELKPKEEPKPAPVKQGAGGGSGGGGYGGGGGGAAKRAKEKEAEAKAKEEKQQQDCDYLKNQLASCRPNVAMHEENEKYFRREYDKDAPLWIKDANAEAKQRMDVALSRANWNKAEANKWRKMCQEIENRMYEKGCLIGPPAP